jgi:hypothetical protein
VGFIFPVSVNISLAAEFIPYQVLDSHQVTQISYHFGAIWQPPKIA